MGKASSECVWRDYYPHQDPFRLSGRPVKHLGGDLDLSTSSPLLASTVHSQPCLTFPALATPSVSY